MDDDRFDRELGQRLRAYESRIPDAEPPAPGTVVRRRTSVVAGTALAAMAAGAILGIVLLNVPRPDGVGDSSPSPAPTSAVLDSVTRLPLDTPRRECVGSTEQLRAIYRIADGSVFSTLFPDAGRAPELTAVDIPLLVVVYEGAWPGATSPALRPSAPPSAPPSTTGQPDPGTADVCVETVDGSPALASASHGVYPGISLVGSPLESTVAEASPSASPASRASTAPAGGWAEVTTLDFSVASIAEAEAGGRLVAVGSEGSSPVLATSDDGMSWTRVDLSTLELGAGWIGFAASAEPGFVVAGSRFFESTEAPGFGTSEPFVIFSPDGGSWEEAPLPDPCVQFHSIATGDFGYALVGGRCRSEGDFDPRPITVLRSVDGRNWASETAFPSSADRLQTPGAIASDGRRIVAIQQGQGIGLAEHMWISDDGGASWETIVEPLPEGINANGIAYGHGRFVVSASGIEDDGSERFSACISEDAEAWSCSPSEPALPRTVVASATGYIGLVEVYPDEFTAYPNGVAVVTSTDGVAWHSQPEAALANLYLSSVHPTTRGIFVAASTNANRTPEDRAEPRVMLYRGTLP